MAIFDTDIDISPEDFYYSMSTLEINELIGILMKNGEISLMNEWQSESMIGDMWSDTLFKLSKNRLLLSSEDEMIIQKISNKY
jgi:hypothetical protein